MSSSFDSAFWCFWILFFFFFTDTATTEIYTLSLHDALPIFVSGSSSRTFGRRPCSPHCIEISWRSEEHTSELQSHSDLVCRLLLEKKKKHKHQLGQQPTVQRTAHPIPPTFSRRRT